MPTCEASHSSELVSTLRSMWSGEAGPHLLCSAPMEIESHMPPVKLASHNGETRTCGNDNSISLVVEHMQLHTCSTQFLSGYVITGEAKLLSPQALGSQQTKDLQQSSAFTMVVQVLRLPLECFAVWCCDVTTICLTPLQYNLTYLKSTKYGYKWCEHIDHEAEQSSDASQARIVSRQADSGVFSDQPPC